MAFAALDWLWPRPRPRHDEQNHSPSGTWLSPTHAKCASFSQPSQRRTIKGSEVRPQTMHDVSLVYVGATGVLLASMERCGTGDLSGGIGVDRCRAGYLWRARANMMPASSSESKVPRVTLPPLDGIQISAFHFFPCLETPLNREAEPGLSDGMGGRFMGTSLRSSGHGLVCHDPFSGAGYL